MRLPRSKPSLRLLSPELEDLASDDDDSAFESASLALERLKRSEARATTRLEQAREALDEAEAAAEQDRRRALYNTGTKAAVEAEKLVGVYAKHAAAIADTLRAIDKLREPIEAANKSLPEGEREIEGHAFRIQSRR